MPGRHLDGRLKTPDWVLPPIVKARARGPSRRPGRRKDGEGSEALVPVAQICDRPAPPHAPRPPQQHRDVFPGIEPAGVCLPGVKSVAPFPPPGAERSVMALRHKRYQASSPQREREREQDESDISQMKVEMEQRMRRWENRCRLLEKLERQHGGWCARLALETEREHQATAAAAARDDAPGRVSRNRGGQTPQSLLMQALQGTTPQGRRAVCSSPRALPDSLPDLPVPRRVDGGIPRGMPPTAPQRPPTSEELRRRRSSARRRDEAEIAELDARLRDRDGLGGLWADPSQHLLDLKARNFLSRRSSFGVWRDPAGRPLSPNSLGMLRRLGEGVEPPAPAPAKCATPAPADEPVRPVSATSAVTTQGAMELLAGPECPGLSLLHAIMLGKDIAFPKPQLPPAAECQAVAQDWDSPPPPRVPGALPALFAAAAQGYPLIAALAARDGPPPAPVAAARGPAAAQRPAQQRWLDILVELAPAEPQLWGLRLAAQVLGSKLRFVRLIFECHTPSSLALRCLAAVVGCNIPAAPCPPSPTAAVPPPQEAVQSPLQLPAGAGSFLGVVLDIGPPGCPLGSLALAVELLACGEGAQAEGAEFGGYPALRALLACCPRDGELLRRLLECRAAGGPQGGGGAESPHAALAVLGRCCRRGTFTGLDLLFGAGQSG
eukprot:TRINITY_DN26234_c0_g1_i1.p1 TRINITY_DN26234_c0_g1~~TRINITY_DN26234_c0_g1_i1.p1  ORF type:complete len:692 (+),score=162.94 TRINITY_DN26234_c0_g1_i1:82-2076(+)